MSENIIEVSHISKSFGGVHALDDVSLTIRRGEIHSLIGENGSGKSTLIKVISGVHAPSAGEIIIEGKKHAKLSPKEAMAAGIQVIYQDFAVFPNLTAAENIAMNIEHYESRNFVRWKRIYQTAERALAQLNISLNLKKEVVNLTVAEKQLVAIARAIICNAKVIIMDEPTTALTRKEVNQLFKIIKSLQKRGITVIFVSHKMDEVLEISENFTVLRNGKKIVSDCVSNLDSKKFAFYMTGREIDFKPYIAQINPGETPIFEVRNLGLQKALKGISFKLRKGEIVGVAGTLGSGRTELGLTLFGYYKMTEGEVFLNGRKVSIDCIQCAVKNGIGHVPEDRITEGLLLHKSILDNTVICKIDALLKPFHMLDKSAVDKTAREWVRNLSIATNDPQNAVSTLSGGNQQKVVLAKWLATDLSVLVLNGPTVGVDIGAKYDIYQILKKLAGQGIGVILISDDITELMTTCNRVLVMNQGRITDELVPAESSARELVEKMTAQTA